MIYIELNEHTFAYELSKNKDNGFSYEGAKALYNYLEDLGEDIEFDAVALRGDFSELTLDEIVKHYFDKDEAKDFIDNLDDEDEVNEWALQMLRDNTTVLEVGDETYIIRAF